MITFENDKKNPAEETATEGEGSAVATAEAPRRMTPEEARIAYEEATRAERKAEAGSERAAVSLSNAVMTMERVASETVPGTQPEDLGIQIEETELANKELSNAQNEVIEGAANVEKAKEIKLRTASEIAKEKVEAMMKEDADREAAAKAGEAPPAPSELQPKTDQEFLDALRNMGSTENSSETPKTDQGYLDALRKIGSTENSSDTPTDQSAKPFRTAAEIAMEKVDAMIKEDADREAAAKEEAERAERNKPIPSQADLMPGKVDAILREQAARDAAKAAEEKQKINEAKNQESGADQPANERPIRSDEVLPGNETDARLKKNADAFEEAAQAIEQGKLSSRLEKYAQELESADIEPTKETGGGTPESGTTPNSAESEKGAAIQDLENLRTPDDVAAKVREMEEKHSASIKERALRGMERFAKFASKFGPETFTNNIHASVDRDRATRLEKYLQEKLTEQQSERDRARELLQVDEARLEIIQNKQQLKALKAVLKSPDANPALRAAAAQLEREIAQAKKRIDDTKTFRFKGGVVKGLKEAAHLAAGKINQTIRAEGSLESGLTLSEMQFEDEEILTNAIDGRMKEVKEEVQSHRDELRVIAYQKQLTRLQKSKEMAKASFQQSRTEFLRDRAQITYERVTAEIDRINTEIQKLTSKSTRANT